MDVKAVLELPKYHRRTFVVLVLAFVVILGFVDFTIVQSETTSLRAAASGYIQSAITAILVSLVVILFVGMFIPPDRRSPGLQQLQPTEITDAFEQLLKNTSRWRYKGNFGRYLRGKVLPTLSGRANIDVDASLIDPQDTRLCARHAQYRSEIQGIDRGRKYDSDVVALEVIITIIHCAWYSTNKKMSIDLYLSSVFDPVRIDSNDEAMILTVEDRRRPALQLSKDHFMYDHFELQTRYAREQGRKVDLARLPRRNSISEIQEPDITEFLDALGMGNLCARLTPAQILKACQQVTNPYEN